jgi:hypothetical protein
MNKKQTLPIHEVLLEYSDAVVNIIRRGDFKNSTKKSRQAGSEG